MNKKDAECPGETGETRRDWKLLVSTNFIGSKVQRRAQEHLNFGSTLKVTRNRHYPPPKPLKKRKNSEVLSFVFGIWWNLVGFQVFSVHLQLAELSLQNEIKSSQLMPMPCCHLCHTRRWRISEVGLLGAAHHAAHAFQGITSTGHNNTRAGRAGRAGVLRYRILDDTILDDTGWYWMILDDIGWYWMILDDTGWPDRAQIDSKDDDRIW